jgi:glycosyltransferase involved in cell wall biosynthesis
MGALSQTGSTYGLQFLLREVLPRLPQVLPFPYEVHLIGGGEPVPPLRPLLKQEHVVLRGFVEDLDQELLLSDVFLLLNNAGPYQAAFTRHLVAWSLGLCLIVHGGSLRAIPEIRQRENALVGSTGEEIAQLIAQAATDRALNARVRRGGRETFEHHFTPTVIAGRIEEELRNIIH